MSNRTIFEMYKDYQDAFQWDCEMLLRKFTTHATHSFECFAEIWQEMQFSSIYAGEYYPYEIAHFTNLVLQCPKKYLIFSDCLFTQTGGLYLLYSLYHEQVLSFLFKVRILFSELKIIKVYLAKVQDAGMKEPLYIFNKMLKENAFQFVASQFDHAKKGIGNVNLANDIFPFDGSSLEPEYIKITNSSFVNIRALDATMINKLNQFLEKNPGVVLDYNHEHTVCMLEALSDKTTIGSPQGIEDEINEDAQQTSLHKNRIINEAFKMNAKSKYLKERTSQ